MEKFIEKFINIKSNETIHPDDINKSFHEAIIKNYQTLLSEQCALCGVKKHQFKLSDMKRIVKLDRTKHASTYQTVLQFGYTVGDSLVDYNKRLAFFSHDINDVLLSQEDLSSSKYPGIFEYNFLFFIGGHYIDDVKVLTDDNDTTFVLNVSDTSGISGVKYNEYLASDAVVTVYIVPNFKIVKRTITKGVLQRNDFVLNTKIIPDAHFTENSLIFLNDETSSLEIKSLCDYKFINKTTVDISEDWVTERNLNRCSFTIINIPKFKLFRGRIFDKYNNPRFFTIDGVDTLIPTTNIIPFPYSKTVCNELTDLSKIKLSLYYPSIVKFEYKKPSEWDSSIRFGYFYDESDLTKYDNKLWLIYKYIKPGHIEVAYEDGEISKRVMNFKPVDVKYYNELYSDTIYTPYTFAYKVDKFSEYINLDSDLLVNYLYTKLKGKMRHYIYMNKLDLSSRIRNDNVNERIPYNINKNDYNDSFQEATFSEPHYVFSLSKSVFGVENEFRFHLDNIFLTPNEYYLQDDVNWYHVYIPCSKVTENSILEIEKFPKVEKTIIIKSNDTVTGVIDFSVPDELSHIYMNTLHIYDTNTLKYLTEDDFTVEVYDDTVQEYITLSYGSRASITKNARITLINEEYHGKELAMYIRTFPMYGEYDNEIGGMSYFSDNMNITRNHVRPYKNGIFMNPISFLRFSRQNLGIFNGKVSMFVNILHDTADNISFDIMPFANTRELAIDGNFCTNKGFVDTGDALSLPIDLKWYDVYVNGRKLNKSNIEVISPNKFFVKNIDSRINLEIWKRGDIPHEFNFNNHDNTINDRIWDNEPYIRDIILENQDILDDSLRDIYDDLVINILDQYKDFVTNVLEYTFINPNEMQLTPDQEGWYPELFNEYSVMWLDSNTYTDAEFKTFINSNERYEEMKNGQYRYGFTPMHIGSHEDAMPGEYMCDPLTGLPGIKDSNDETIIPGGSINRVVVHKNKFINDLSSIGMPRASVYQLQFNDNVTSKLVTPNVSVLDDVENQIIDKNVPEKICFSIDMDILKSDSNNVMGLVDCDPIIRISYFYDTNNGKNTETIWGKLSILSRSPISTLSPGATSISNFTITNISVDDSHESSPDLSEVKMILHSILIAF